MGLRSFQLGFEAKKKAVYALSLISPWTPKISQGIWTELHDY